MNGFQLSFKSIRLDNPLEEFKYNTDTRDETMLSYAINRPTAVQNAVRSFSEILKTYPC